MEKLEHLEVHIDLVKKLINESSLDKQTMTYIFPNGSFNINQGYIGLKSCEKLMGMDALFIEQHDFRPSKELLANFIFAAVFNSFDELVDKDLNGEVFNSNSHIMNDEYGYVTNEVDRKYNTLDEMFPSLNPDVFLPFLRRLSYDPKTELFSYDTYENVYTVFPIDNFINVVGEIIKEPRKILWCDTPCADEVNSLLNFMVFALLHSVDEALVNQENDRVNYLDNVIQAPQRVHNL